MNQSSALCNARERSRVTSNDDETVLLQRRIVTAGPGEYSHQTLHVPGP